MTKLPQASNSPQCVEASTEANIRVLITVHASIIIRIIEFPDRNKLGRDLHVLASLFSNTVYDCINRKSENELIHGKTSPLRLLLPPSSSWGAVVDVYMLQDAKADMRVRWHILSLMDII
jgi:hypothetical protein